MAASLFLVATPIGNPEDITLRALAVLRSADLIVCEERREGERLLRRLEISRPIEMLNEHNETEASGAILARLKEGKTVALISDCGTPVFSDPGRTLVAQAGAEGIRVVPVPGASSLMPALTVSGFPIDRFLFYGWLSPKKEERKRELRDLVHESRTVVLMDTPYRLMALLRDVGAALGERRRVCLAYELTMPAEQIWRGTVGSILREIGERELKGEFVLVIEGENVRRGG